MVAPTNSRTIFHTEMVCCSLGEEKRFLLNQTSNRISVSPLGKEVQITILSEVLADRTQRVPVSVFLAGKINVITLRPNNQDQSMDDDEKHQPGYSDVNRRIVDITYENFPSTFIKGS